MFTSAHLTSGVAVGLALGLHDAPLAAFVLASVFTDWDYAFQLATGRNHRTLVTHSPPVHLVVWGALGFAHSIFWWILAGTMLHFSLDVWEYGLRLDPFHNRIYGFRLLPGVEDMRFGEYLRTYFTDKRFLAAEVGFAALAALLVAWRYH
ncbi:MAG TPA: hypothetical protein VM370_06665 [Candidatus Thermoplasmatota archaeon]|nr:hypothetical protein [Candidatus Thermoplasmatota archaeon]